MFRTILICSAAISTSAYAADCPDKPVQQEVLAPQAAQLAAAPTLSQATIDEPAFVPLPKLDIPQVVSDPMFVESPTKPNEPVLQKPEFTQMAQAAPDAADNAAADLTKDVPTMKATTPADKYEAVLQNRISPGADGLMVFDYAGAKSAGDLETIAEYVSYLEGQNPTTMSDLEATAYWANLYNAVTLRVVLENYPVSSIKKIGGGLFSSGPWKKEIINVNGRAMSLDNVEHDTLRKDYPSPYIHYMVNCASIGCPNLLPDLWRADTLQTKRKEAARAYINSSRGVKMNGDTLVVSSIYDWFEEDFGGNKAGVLKHIRQHADSDLAAAIDNGAKISKYEYDWDLNE